MQVLSSNKSSNLYGNTSSQLANYSSKDNALFQNLLADTDVQESVTKDADGRYSLSSSENTPLSNHQLLAKLLIS